MFLLILLVLLSGLKSLEGYIKDPCVIAFPKKYSALYDSLKYQGFCEVGNRRFLKFDYKRLYNNFDTFIALISCNKALADYIYALEKEFLAHEEYKSRYCSAPPSYRDPKVHTTKRFNKIYFQFIKEYYDLFIAQQTNLEGKDTTTVIEFLTDMRTLDSMAKEFFAQIIDELEISKPGIKAILYGKHKELTVISKIVRYEKIDDWGTTPHCDKSAFTLIWGSDDDNDDSLLVCQDMQHPSCSKLEKPQRVFSHQDTITSTILISGSACDKLGVDLTPTVHGVAPIKKEYRHAVISFLLIPDIDMSGIMSDFIEPTTP